VSYFRPQKARKTAPRSTSSLPDSTQKVSRKRGRVKMARVSLKTVSPRGFTPMDLDSGVTTQLGTQGVSCDA